MVKDIKFILDSGAFSAWTKQKEINLDAYIDFCKKHDQYIDHIVTLDVIPGKWGEKEITPDDFEQSAKKGWENYIKMRDAGLPMNKLLHVFHQGESFKWLEKIVNEFEYIGISPGNDRGTLNKMKWIDQCMKYVCDKDGYPKIKFHGFGVTALRLLFRYPWYSTDSTKWLAESRYGRVILPDIVEGFKKMWLVPVSSQQPTRKERQAHITTFSEGRQKYFNNYIKSKGYILGKSSNKNEDSKYKLKENERWFDKEKYIVECIEEEGLINSIHQRSELNILFFLQMLKEIPEWPWPYDFNKKEGFPL
jgi:hypothetical protein